MHLMISDPSFLTLQWQIITLSSELIYQDMIFIILRMVVILSIFRNVSSTINVTIGLLAPLTGARVLGDSLFHLVEDTFILIKNDPNFSEIKRHDVNFVYKFRDTACDIGQGLYELVSVMDFHAGKDHKIDTFIGPVCDELCMAAGHLAKQWNIPMVSFGCAEKSLSDNNLYSTFARVSTPYLEMEMFIEDTIKHFGWHRLIIAEGSEKIWRESAEHIDVKLEKKGYDVNLLSIYNDPVYLTHHLKVESYTTRVFLIYAYPRDVIGILCAANELGLLNGEYAFLTVDFGLAFHDSDLTCPINVTDGVLDFSFDILSAVNHLAHAEHEDEVAEEEAHEKIKNGIGLHLLSDAVYLYASALNKVLAKGYTPKNISMIMKNMQNVTITTPYGVFSTDENGTRMATFALYNIFNENFTQVAGFNSTQSRFFRNVSIIWPGGGTHKPLGRPACGWNKEYCITVQSNTYLIASVSAMAALVVLLCIAFVAIFIHLRRKRLLKEEMENMEWKISFCDLDTSSGRTFHSMCSKSSFLNDTRTSRSQSISIKTEMSGAQQIFTKTAKYQGSIVAIKHVNKAFVAITPSVIQEINQIRHLKHNNVFCLNGACVDPLNIYIVSTYYNKGSLLDVLSNSNIKLDWIFKLSFASDIAKGMIFIHDSVIESHGKLRSSNIYIDSRWMCKIGDLPMPNFCDGEKMCDDEKNSESFKLLWVAPELLRLVCFPPKGTQKGDIYAFAIILQEIILRATPYENETLEPNEIVQRVKTLESPPFRPKVPANAADRKILDLMRMCWEEIPMFRPNFSTILSVLKQANNGRKPNLVDQMMHMMEKYADHLEELVGERTRQLEEEQKKTDELLHRMLPPSIAHDLKYGKPIRPETVDCVTIFFSDIVQFTKLASESTAIEIVNFLNDLYTCFDTIIEHYDVYKVETIGDAYMVVSGLPVKNGLRHASEIATMALDLLSSVTTFEIRHRPNRQLQLRIGIHSGPVCAGVVGLKMPRYCLFGDTVNQASRMESSGLALRIHVSESCRDILEKLGGFQLTFRGQINMKGLGPVPTYFLTGKEGFTKELPSLNLAASLEDHEFK
uniref:Guanylate cyclase n=1 Tax=Crassostrea virginica TaxID=6565 RepID=A0A8B8CLZ3_CRAVI|nr:atrial natriuretic peptide receptor 1-like isoform X2 [Crassostrea virginica]